MESNRGCLEFFGLGCGIVFGLGLLCFGGWSCASWVKDFHEKETHGGYYVVAGQTYDHYKKKYPEWQGSAPRSAHVKPVATLPASKTSKNRRCTGNPYAASAANTFGVPQALVECVHFAESSCGVGGMNKGKYTAWSAVLKLRKPIQQRHALNIIAKDLGVPAKEMRSNRCGAMGPFQFLPSGWVASGVDADGDGKVNPYSLADATYGGANHLARAKAKTGSWRGAIAKRNSKKSYVAKVASCAGL